MLTKNILLNQLILLVRKQTTVLCVLDEISAMGLFALYKNMLVCLAVCLWGSTTCINSVYENMIQWQEARVFPTEFEEEESVRNNAKGEKGSLF